MAGSELIVGTSVARLPVRRLIDTGSVVPILGGAVAAITVAATLRLPSLDAIGFTSDEAVYAGQGAALVGIAPYDELFSLFRAHPLLLQGTIGAAFHLFGVGDFVARTVVVILFGIGTVLGTYLLARELYGALAAAFSTLLLAALPYHVILSRQVMVDTAMAFFAVLALWMLVAAIRRRSEGWLLGAAIVAAAATLTKEVAILLLVPVGIYIAATGEWRRFRTSGWFLAAMAYLIVIAPFILSRALGPQGNASEFVLWQFARPPNHAPDYFARVAIQFFGPGFGLLTLAGAIHMMRARAKHHLLLALTVLVLAAFFQLWPTKLFPYLMPIAPLVSVIAGVGAASIVGVRWRVGKRVWATGAVALLTILIGHATLTSWATVHSAPARPDGYVDLDVELQDFGGAREAGLWARDNTPPGSRMLTIGPSLGNILRFYGHRDSVALSVSPDPRQRNPAYVPIPNPDRALRDSSVHYLVWDAYSADRSAFYSERLLAYAQKYRGIVVFSAYIGSDGSLVAKAGPAPAGAEARILIFNTGAPQQWQRDSPADS